jgi:hypothetical protein
MNAQPAGTQSPAQVAPVGMSIGMKLTLALFMVMLAACAWGILGLAGILQSSPGAPSASLLLALATQLAKCTLFFFACWGSFGRKAYGRWLGTAAILLLGLFLVGDSALHLYRAILGLPEPPQAIAYANDSERAGALLANITAVAVGPWLIWKWTGVFVRSERSRRYFAGAPRAS